jgi:hypothetical protein
LTIVTGCAALVFVTRGRLTPERTPLAAAALIAFGLAASPVAWTHYQVLQYPGVAIVFCYAVRARLWRIVASTVICGSLLYQLPVSVLRMFYNRAHAWPKAPAVLYFWTTVPVLASLVLSGVMMFCLLHMRLREEKNRAMTAVPQI